jgi:hypothetical protein
MLSPVVYFDVVPQVMVAATERHKMMAKPRYSSDPSSATGGLLSSTVSSQQDRQARDQQRITIMLISVVVVFLLCQLPQAVQHIYIVYYIIIGKKHSMYQMQVCDAFYYRITKTRQECVSFIDVNRLSLN